MLHAGIATVRADGALVGDRLGEVDPGILEAIDSGHNLRPDDTPQRLIARISAAIIDMARRDGGDVAIFVQRYPGIAERPVIAVRARSHVLGARFHPLDGTSASLFRSQRADRHLRIAGDLDSETAANVGGLDPYAVNVYVQVCC